MRVHIVFFNTKRSEILYTRGYLLDTFFIQKTCFAGFWINLVEVKICQVYVQFDIQLLNNVWKKTSEMNFGKDVFSYSYVVLLSCVITYEVPNILHTCWASSHWIFAEIEYFMHVVSDALHNVLRSKACLLIFTQKHKAVSDQEFGSSCNNFNDRNLSRMIKLGICTNLSEVSQWQTSLVHKWLKFSRIQRVLVNIIEVVDQLRQLIVLHYMARSHYFLSIFFYHNFACTCHHSCCQIERITV